MRILLLLIVFACTTFSGYSDAFAQKGSVDVGKGGNSYEFDGNGRNRGNGSQGNLGSGDFHDPMGISASPAFYVQFMGYQSEEEHDMNMIEDLPLYLTPDEIAMTTRLRYAGDENYLIRPVNENSAFRVYEYVYNEHTASERGDMVYEGMVGESLLISCNSNTLIPDYIIETTETDYVRGIVHSYSPALSAVGGYDAYYGPTAAPFPTIENPSTNELPPIQSILCDVFEGFVYGDFGYMTFANVDSVLFIHEPTELNGMEGEEVCIIYEERTFFHEGAAADVTNSIFVEVYEEPVG